MTHSQFFFACTCGHLSVKPSPAFPEQNTCHRNRGSRSFIYICSSRFGWSFRTNSQPCGSVQEINTFTLQCPDSHVTYAARGGVTRVVRLQVVGIAASRSRRRVARDGLRSVSKPRLLVHDTKCVLHLYEAITQRSRISDEKSVDRYSRRIKVVYNRIRIMMVMTGSFPR